MSSFKLSLEDRTFLAHYTSLRDEEAASFASANEQRMREVYGRVNALGASSSEWLKPRAVTRLKVLVVSPRGMSSAPPLSRKDAALLDHYRSLSGNAAVTFFEQHRADLINASLAAAQAEDDGVNAAAPGQFPPLPPQTPTTTATTANAPQLAGTLELRLALASESDGPAIVLDIGYGVGSPVRALTVPISAIVPGWVQSLAINLHQQQPRLARPGEPGVTPLPAKAPAAIATASLPSRLRRLVSRKST